MAVQAKEKDTSVLTYEDYMAEGEVFKRYDILDGVRIFMTNPTRRHQEILGNIFEHLRNYQRQNRIGKAYVSPCDILIARNPLRTRQPDLLFISHEQLVKCPDDLDPAPLEAAPELVVEILSASDTRRTRNAKIADYCAVGVRECWVVSPEAETVEVLRLSPDGPERMDIYGPGQTVRSVCLEGLEAPADSFFAV
ncbi:MAG: Uma2 family endonuclease [Armatimonadetes bacterium]|nr:Uma2 family endonuclease [Armatimonadota bacterium]